MCVLEPNAVSPSRIRTRVKWFALGVLNGVGWSAALGMYLAAIQPPELSSGVRPTVEPPQTGQPAPRPPKLDLGPCPADAKDCIPFDDARPIHTVPEPGPLALIGAGAVALTLTRRKP